MNLLPCLFELTSHPNSAELLYPLIATLSKDPTMIPRLSGESILVRLLSSNISIIEEDKNNFTMNLMTVFLYFAREKPDLLIDSNILGKLLHSPKTDNFLAEFSQKLVISKSHRILEYLVYNGLLLYLTRSAETKRSSWSDYSLETKFIRSAKMVLSVNHSWCELIPNDVDEKIRKDILSEIIN